MKRLRDDINATDPTARTAAALLRRMPPLAPDAQRQRRVRLQLGAPRRWARFGFHRPAIALFILLISVAGASAMAGGGWTYARKHISWLALPAREATPPGPRATPARRRSAAPRNEATTAPTAAPAPTALPAGPSLPGPDDVPVLIVENPAAETMPAASPPGRRAGPTRRVVRLRHPATTRPTPELPPTPGAALMMEAIAARRDGDLARAERLLAEYRRSYPAGALQEEALVLSLEAAALRGDPAAAALARVYLTRFPHGRFKARVEQLLRAAPR